MVRLVIIAICCAALLTGVVGVTKQSQRLTRLRAADSRPATEKQESPTTPEPAIAADPAPTLELLRLRSEVTKLQRQKNELAGVEEQHEALKVQFANKPKGLPEGYIRKSEAQMRGYNSPADTLQTFLWAVQNTNVAVFLDSVTPELRREIEEQIQRTGQDEFFRTGMSLPGMRIVSQENLSPTEIVLGIEVLPDEPLPEKIHVLLVNGQWKLKMK